MDTPRLVSLSGLTGWSLGLLVVTVLSLVALAVVLRGLRRARHEATEHAARARTAQLALEQRLEELTARLTRLEPVARHEPAYVITDAGEADQPGSAVAVPDRIVLSAAVGEPLVKAVALGHGLRRALSPESRNRIRFEVRRETRRSRRQRRREMREAWLASKRASAAERREGPSEAASAA
jgi:hypothetical protein